MLVLCNGLLMVHDCLVVVGQRSGITINKKQKNFLLIYIFSLYTYTVYYIYITVTIQKQSCCSTDSASKSTETAKLAKETEQVANSSCTSWFHAIQNYMLLPCFYFCGSKNNTNDASNRSAKHDIGSRNRPKISKKSLEVGTQHT